MPGELLAAAAAGLSVIAIQELKRRTGAEYLATHSLPEAYAGPKGDSGSGRTTQVVRSGNVGRGLDLNRQTRCCAVPVAQRNSSPICCRVRMGTISHPCRTTPHWGLDIVAPTGTPVYAAKAGTVVEAQPRQGYGNQIQIAHADNAQSTLYAHLSRMDVRPGQTVGANQQIGLVGNTILPPDPTMGAHCHFEVHNLPRPNLSPTSRRLDPVQWLEQHNIRPAGIVTGPVASLILPDDDGNIYATEASSETALAGLMPAYVVQAGIAVAVGAVILALIKMIPRKED